MLSLFLALIALTQPAAALDRPVPPARENTTLNIPGGTGWDWTEVIVQAKESDFQNGFSPGLARLNYNVTTERLESNWLPSFDVLQKCEFRRVNGGRVGDYKPKSIVNGIRVGRNAPGFEIFLDDHSGQDFNDDPVVQKYKVQDLRGVTPSAGLRQILRTECANGHSFADHSIDIYYFASGWCRWKPENWFKPGNFPWEYPQKQSTVARRITLWCLTDR